MYRSLAVALELWLAAMAVVVVLRIVSGKLSLDGLLVAWLVERGGIRPHFERYQNLWVTVMCLVGYVGQAVLVHKQSVTHRVMPDVSPALVATMLASHTLYLGGKFVRNRQGDAREIH